MVDQVTADDYSDGVDGKGQKWKDRVDTDRAEGNFTGGIDSEAASDLTENALESSDDYQSNLAAAFGIESVDSGVVSEWEENMDSDAQQEWQTQTADSGEDWRDGVKRTSASDWESETADAAQDWLNNTREGLSPD